MKPLLPFFLSLLLFPVQLLAQLSAEDEAFILSFMEENKVPGISVAIVEQGKIIYAKAFGVADQKTGEKLTPQTLFQAASISKPFTGLLYMRKAQQETLDLDVPINQYLEDWTLPGYKRDPEQVATARLLLAHQGGTNMSGFLGWRQTRKRVPDLDEVLRGKKVHLWERRIYTKYPLNTRFAYSGGGYSVLEK
ncbi:MAG: serine hydrolase domain-containing protein, partial [Bacteroidota bacterium]